MVSRGRLINPLDPNRNKGITPVAIHSHNRAARMLPCPFRNSSFPVLKDLPNCLPYSQYPEVKRALEIRNPCNHNPTSAPTTPKAARFGRHT